MLSFDLPRLHTLFLQYAEETKTCALKTFTALLVHLGVRIKTGIYALQYFRAFDIDAKGCIDFRKFCLGLMVSDPECLGHNSLGWQQLRLSFMFRFYDLDNDGRMSLQEFHHFVRHMLREAKQPHDIESVTKAAKQVAGSLSVSSPYLSLEYFVKIVGSGELGRYGLHTTPLLRLPPFRHKLQAEEPAQAPAPPSLSTSPTVHVTRTTNMLQDVEIKLLFSACGYSPSDTSIFQELFLTFADLPPLKLDGAKRCSQSAFAALLSHLRADAKYSDHYFRAFDSDDSESVDMREFCLGLILMDSELRTHPGDQWLRCRLEMIFRFYDLDNDGQMSLPEFYHFVRHMLREAKQPHDIESVTKVAKQVAGSLSVSSPYLSLEYFIKIVGSGELGRHGLHTTPLLRLPPFRHKIKTAAARSPIPLKPALKKTGKKGLRHPSAKKKKLVRHVAILGRNEIPIEKNNRGRKAPGSAIPHKHLNG